ncbi:MAG TPA: hypothetical protein DDY98_03140, partial [Ruminococcaceae bacterium]|nr:hypothetical protein [Oscillospiraceae bacterium]
MKKILSAVLALCMIFGCMTAGFTAQAASTQADLQNGINQAIANGDAVYTWNGGNLTLTKTLTINGNIKVDFNGATIKGAPHFSTVYIGSGNVELYNVTLEGRGAKYYEIPSFISEIADARTTLLIGNANVTLDSVVVLGAMVRVVGTQETLPMSDAIGIGAANAVVNLKNVRAFGNIGVENLNGSTVNVEECIIGGYQADFYNDAKVNFAAGTTQYRSMDLIKEALADCVTLTANEEKYMNALFDEYFEITASVKDLNYVAPTYDYDADTDTLTVTATADKPVAKVQNAFEYSYVPKTATILSTTEDFVLSNDGTYVATFANIPADTQCDTDLDYALSLDLGEDADAYIHQFLNNITNFVADFPAFMGKAFEELDVAVDKYINGEQGYATILWNFYNDKDVGAKTLINAIEDPTEKAKAEADVKKLLGPLFDLCGASLMGNDRLNTALAAKVAGTSVQRQDAEIERQMDVINNTYGSTITAENGGIGLLDTFLAYAGDIEALLLKTEGGKYVINDVEGLGKYIGANYLEMYDYLKDVGDFVRNVVALINDSDNYVMKLLEENNFTIDGKKLSDFASDLNGYVATMDDLFAAADKFFATNPSYTAIVKEYGADGITDTCGRYLEKAYNAALNPDAYLGLNTNGNFVEGFSFAKDATYTT